jgi:hypothetical protein
MMAHPGSAWVPALSSEPAWAVPDEEQTAEPTCAPELAASSRGWPTASSRSRLAHCSSEKCASHRI